MKASEQSSSLQSSTYQQSSVAYKSIEDTSSVSFCLDLTSSKTTKTGRSLGVVDGTNSDDRYQTVDSDSED